MKRALIVANLIGFVGFLWDDIDILISLGYEVTFAACAKIEDADIHMSALEARGIKFVPIGFSSKKAIDKANLKAYFAIKHLMSEGEFDLIHCHTPIAGLLTRMAARNYRKKAKIIYTSHGLTFTWHSTLKQRLFYSAIEKLASRYTDTLILINHEDYEKAQRWFCKDVRLIRGVGVDTKEYHDVVINKENYKKSLGLPTDKMMVLSVGELSPRKNHQIIIHALGGMQNKSDYIYVVCGKEIENTGYADYLKKLADEQGVQLYLLGHRDDIPQILHCSDIGAIPSIREGLGMAGIQSLCAEIPLVGSKVQGIQEYVIDGVTGILCSPFDTNEFANAIEVLSDSKTRSAMREHCYSIAKTFDKQISHAQMMKIYKSITEGNRNE